jgi:hypothetical protein
MVSAYLGSISDAAVTLYVHVNDMVQGQADRPQTPVELARQADQE